MACIRCGGFWIELREDSHCVQCGNRTMPNHQFCSVGESLSDADRKRKRLKPNNTSLGRPTKAAREQALKDHPQDLPLEEHPYMLFLAKQWEDHEAAIGVLKRKQDDLKIAAHDFSESYPEINIKPQNVD